MNVSHSKIRKTVPYSPLPDAKKIIVDVDPGCDDALLLLVLSHILKVTGKELVGLTITAGNTDLDNAVTNTLISMHIAGLNAPVYKGSKSSLLGERNTDNYFGDDGLNGAQKEYRARVTFQQEKQIHKKSAAEFIAESAVTYGKDLVIICTGPLTNLAVALMVNRQIPELIGGICIMGGSYSCVGLNEYFSAEFNFAYDAYAANLVLKSFKNAVLMTLETAFQFPGSNFQKYFESEATNKAKFVKRCFKDKNFLVCDPLALFPVFFPEAVKGVFSVYGEVCLEGKRTHGMLSVEWLGFKSQRKANIQLVVDLDLAFVDRILEESLHQGKPKKIGIQESTDQSKE